MVRLFLAAESCAGSATGRWTGNRVVHRGRVFPCSWHTRSVERSGTVRRGCGLIPDISRRGERSTNGSLIRREIMRNWLLVAGLLIIGAMMACFLRSDLCRSGAGAPLPPSGPLEDGQGLDLQRALFPELIQEHRVPPIDAEIHLSPATREEVRDRPLPPRVRRLEIPRDSWGPLPPGDWDWEVIRPQFPVRDRPDFLLMRELGPGGDPCCPLRR
jgi:hypothetical protein